VPDRVNMASGFDDEAEAVLEFNELSNVEINSA
jgi:hypothetical protein